MSSNIYYKEGECPDICRNNNTCDPSCDNPNNLANKKETPDDQIDHNLKGKKFIDWCVF